MRLMSDQRAGGLLITMILVGVLIVGLSGNWWPEIYIVLGIPLATWCLVRGRPYDAGVFAVIFGLGWVTGTWVTPYAFIFPTLIAIAALFTLCRDVFRLDPEEAEEREEELESEIQEERNPNGSSRPNRPL
ncbi:MAG: hypothetical protein ACOYKZ_01620 [Chlamydiia bacterium]